MSDSAQTSPNPSPGEWLSHQMERRPISVRELADALEVTEKAVYDWRRDRSVVSENRVPQLAKVLNISELEARRGLGYWVPPTLKKAAAMNARKAAEMDAIIADLTDVLERFRRWRKEGD